jgi:hypothetical protein
MYRCILIHSVNIRVGGATAQAVSRCLPRRRGFSPRSGHVGFGRQNVAGTCSLQVLRFLLPILVPSTAPYSLITLSSTLYTVLIQTASLNIKQWIVDRHSVGSPGSAHKGHLYVKQTLPFCPSVCLPTYLPTYLSTRIYLSIYLSIALEPFVGPWPFFSFLIFLHSR